MIKDLQGILFSFGYIFIIIFTAKFFDNYGKEFSRKYIHIMVSNWWIIAMFFFDDFLWAAIVPSCFIVINYISYKYKMFSSMEREEDEGMGTVYYAISLLILVIWSFGVIKHPYIGGIGILIMGYGDGFAAIIGKKYGTKTYKIFGSVKSLQGSLTMFMASLSVTFIIVSIYCTSFGILDLLTISLVATIIEGLSIKGLDNLSVPLISSGLAYFLLVV